MANAIFDLCPGGRLPLGDRVDVDTVGAENRHGFAGADAVRYGGRLRLRARAPRC